jgi:hypothetical protein
MSSDPVFWQQSAADGSTAPGADGELRHKIKT